MSDVNTVEKPIEVKRTQGTIDSLAASMRYLIVVLTALPAILAFLENRDIVGLINFMRDGDGKAVIAAAVALGTMAYGIFKTRKRGAQIATVAASSKVPNSIAKIG